jgi:hypothetical protein
MNIPHYGPGGAASILPERDKHGILIGQVGFAPETWKLLYLINMSNLINNGENGAQHDGKAGIY